MTLRKRSIIILFLVIGCAPTLTRAQENTLHQLNDLLIRTVMEDLFTPPVASRIYVPPNIAFYECIRHNNPAYPEVFRKLNGGFNLPAPTPQSDNFISAVIAFTAVAQNLVASEHLIENWKNGFVDSIRKHRNELVIINSINYGTAVADSIIKWMQEDNYMKSRALMRFVHSEEEGAWQPTPVDYAQGLEPHWSTLRPMILKSPSQCSPKKKLKYSSSKKSEFFKNVMEVYNLSKNLDSNQKMMAIYWDDNPNVSVVEGHLNYFVHKISPAGHWMMIARQAMIQKNISIERSSLVYALTGIALFDAFISCWDEKYKTNLIRPVTVINLHIDQNWKPFIQTPPFPEFTSGHSVISNAAATVLTEILGDKWAFTDDTEIPFGLKPRSFASFYEAAYESTWSRVYGGIHYPETARISIEQGKQVGKYVIDKIYKSTTRQ